MNNTVFFIFTPLMLALSAGLLTWFAIDVGTSTMARYRASFTDRARFQVKEFFLAIDPSKLFMLNIGMMALGGMVTWTVTGSAFIAFPVFFLLALLPRYIYAWMRKKRLQNFEEQLPDALMMMSGALRAGVSLNAAIQQLVIEGQAPLTQEFTLMLREQRLGVTLEQSLNNLARRMPTQTTTLVVSALCIAHETGGNLAETLERTAQTIRNRLQMEGKINALTAQGKLQAWVVGLLPFVLMMVLNSMEPEAMSQLWNTRLGWGILTILGFLECMGLYIIRKIIAIDV